VPDHFYIYPSYLRKPNPRTLGRRVPAELALPEVTPQQIAEAAQRLGLRAEVEPSKNYPKEAHRLEGRVRIVKRPGATKQGVLRQIAEALRATAAADGARA
jgi:signal recognition particle subunit SRP19